MSGGTLSRSWDPGFRPASEVNSGSRGHGQNTYDYDSSGERRLKTLGATTETVYADRMYELENGSSRELASVNVYLGDTRIVSKVVPLDSPSPQYEQQNTFYYHSDHIGNSTLITDYQGNEFKRLAFTPHGEVWHEDSSDALNKVNFLFTGKEMDAETGWYNFGKRYLNPTTGLWLSADPALASYIPEAPLTDDARKHNENLPGMGGVYNPVNFALYHFAGNNPIRFTDPTGLESFLNMLGPEARARLTDSKPLPLGNNMSVPFGAGLQDKTSLPVPSSSRSTPAPKFQLSVMISDTAKSLKPALATTSAISGGVALGAAGASIFIVDSPVTAPTAMAAGTVSAFAGATATICDGLVALLEPGPKNYVAGALDVIGTFLIPPTSAKVATFAENATITGMNSIQN